MKLHKILKVGEERVKIVSDTFVLEEKAAGRAIVTVISETPLAGLASLAIGYGDTIERWFTGKIETCVRIDHKQHRLTISELPAVLGLRWTISRRNVAARDILAELGKKSGISIVVAGGAGWLDNSAAHFVNLGTGYDLLDVFGRIYQIPDYCWIPQPDGSVYVGDYNDSAVSKKIIGLRADLFTGLSAVGADCAAIPTLRPGQRIRISDGDVLRITQVTLAGNTMRVNFG